MGEMRDAYASKESSSGYKRALFVYSDVRRFIAFHFHFQTFRLYLHDKEKCCLPVMLVSARFVESGMDKF